MRGIIPENANAKSSLAGLFSMSSSSSHRYSLEITVQKVVIHDSNSSTMAAVSNILINKYYQKTNEYKCESVRAKVRSFSKHRLY